MAEPKVSKLQFMDGAAVEDVVRAFVAADLQSGNYNLTRLCYLRDPDEWRFFDVETVVVSVCVVPSPKRTYYALGRDGLVWSIVSGGDPVTERIPDAGTRKGKRGYVLQIKDIAGEVYVCGDEGQVYRRAPGGWAHMDKGVLEPARRDDANCHNGIDGTGPDDIYVVGEWGRIFHYDGKKWKRVGFQTNHHLERVRCAGRDEVYVCGAHGMLLKGNRRGFRFVGDPDMTGHIWDLEVFQDRVYLAVEDTLMVYDGKTIEPVETGLTPPPDAHRLSARNGVLWSFGEKDLAYTDGTAWTRVIHPDNV